jgi:hypothetical protein
MKRQIIGALFGLKAEEWPYSGMGFDEQNGLQKYDWKLHIQPFWIE